MNIPDLCEFFENNDLSNARIDWVESESGFVVTMFSKSKVKALNTTYIGGKKEGMMKVYKTLDAAINDVIRIGFDRAIIKKGCFLMDAHLEMINE